MTNSPEITAAVAAIWEASVAVMDARLDAIDAAGAALLTGSLDDERSAAAAAAAHKLAGSLGTFGLPEGSVLAGELETLLRTPGTPSVLRLSELAERLRAIVDAGPPAVDPAEDPPGTLVADMPAAAPRPAADGSGVVDVMMVDDDIVLTRLVQHALETRGYSVSVIADGRAALDALTGPAPVQCRLLLLDVDLPGLDGFAVLRRLVAAGVTRTTPTIMLTVRASEREILEALSSGAVDHVTKPFSVPILMQRVRLALER